MKCKEIYAEVFGDLKSTVTVNEWELVEKQVEAFSRVLTDAGLDAEQAIRSLNDLDDLSEAGQALSDILDAQMNMEAKKLARQSLTEFQNTSKNTANWERLKRDVEKLDGITVTGRASKKGDAEKLAIALQNMIVSPGKGQAALNKMVETVKSTWREQKLLKRIDEAFTNVNLDKMLKSHKFLSDVSVEYHNILHSIPQHTTNNQDARKLAQIVFDVRNEQRATMNTINSSRTYRKNGLPIQFNLSAIMKNTDAFVTKFANALNAKTHGDLGRRTSIARSVAKSLEDNNGVIDWDEIGDIAPVDEVNALDAANGYKTEPILEYGSGEAWADINNEFGSKDFLATVNAEIDNLATKEAAIRMFGEDYKKNFSKLLERATKDAKGKVDAKTANINKATESYFRRQVEIQVPDSMRLNKFLTGARMFEVSTKLGSAVVSALTDIPVMMHMARNFYDVPFFKAVSSTLSGTGKQSRERAKHLGSWSEGASSFVANRFGAGIETPSERMGSGISRAAEFVMNASGLNLWTGAWKAGVTRMLDTHMGDMIKANTKFTDLPQRIRSGLERFNISEADWNTRVLESDLIDENGNFDLFRILDNEAEVSGSDFSLRTKFTSYYKDAADAMVLTPEAKDFNYLSGPFEPNSVQADIFKTLTQFMSFPTTFFRKVTARTLTDSDLTVNKRIQAITGLFITATMMNMLVVQSKQVLNGNNPYEWDDGDLWFQAVSKNGVLGLPFDIFSTFGGDEVLRELFGVSEPSFDDMQSMLGPFFGDVMKLVENAGGLAGDDPEKALSKMSRQILSSVPGNNLWYTKILYRTMLVDTMQEMVDPISYQKRKRRQLSQSKGRMDLLTGNDAITKQNFIAKSIEDTKR